MRPKIIFSLRVKLTIFTILLIASVGGIVMTVTADRMRDTLSTEVKERGVVLAKSIARSSEDAMVGKGDELYLFQFITSAMKNRGVDYAVIVDSEGMVRAHSDIQKSGVKYDEPKGLTPDETGDGYTIRAGARPGGGRYYDITVPIVMAGSSNKSIGAVHLGLSRETVEEAASKAARLVAQIAVAGLFLGGLGAFTLATLMVGPIKQLADGVRKVGEGNLDQEIAVSSRDEIGELTLAFNDMTKGLREKEFIKDTFERYMSKQLAEKLLKDFDRSKIELGGERRSVTVLFADIRGFTTMSETLDPKGVISFLNDYFSMMVDVVFENNGWIDKFIGDAIMVVYGLPVSYEDDAVRAVRTGLRMREAMTGFNERRAALGQPPIHMGVGINSGEVIAGNVGSRSRMNYTVIGDEVNTASRLEALSKLENVIISHNTYELVKDRFIVEKRGAVSLKGKSETVLVYEVIREI